MPITESHHRRISKLTALILSLCFSLSLNSYSNAAELPELASPSTGSGQTTTAQFFGAASSDEALSFKSFFESHEVMDLTGQVKVETDHIGRAGNLYIVVELDGQFFMRDTQGNYQDWDLELGKLQATVANKILQTVETLMVVEQANLTTFGYAGAEIAIYFAYDLVSGSGELYYSGTPVIITIADYDPLQTAGSTAEILDLLVVDSNRNREIPVLIYRPSETTPSPVLLFSHGLGGNRFNITYLASHWSQRGYTVVNLQHPGSDESIFNVPPSQYVASFVAAASLENSIARVRDVHAVLDQLENWNVDPDSQFYQQLDLSRVGMSGHSFGARTSQAVSGEITPWIPGVSTDPRIDAATIFSPSLPAAGDPVEIFTSVEVPWLLMTGTLDEVSIGTVNTPVEERLAVFPALPPGDRYELVLFEGEHHAFTDHDLSLLQNPRNPAHHPIIEALSSAFWDTWLLGNQSAKSWLEQGGAASILEPGDRWQFK